MSYIPALVSPLTDSPLCLCVAYVQLSYNLTSVSPFVVSCQCKVHQRLLAAAWWKSEVMAVHSFGTVLELLSTLYRSITVKNAIKITFRRGKVPKSSCVGPLTKLSSDHMINHIYPQSSSQGLFIFKLNLLVCLCGPFYQAGQLKNNS